MAPKRKINETEKAVTRKRGRPSSSTKDNIDDKVVPAKKRGRPASNKNESKKDNNSNLGLSMTAAMQTRSATNGGGGSTAKSATGTVKSGRVAGKPKVASSNSNVVKARKKPKGSNETNVVGNGSKTAKAKKGSSERRGSQVSITIPVDPSTDAHVDENENENEESDGPSYWLMKAEPESRMEKGKDVKFSIDDLEAASGPEAWDGKLLSSGIVKKLELIRKYIGVRNATGLIMQSLDYE